MSAARQRDVIDVGRRWSVWVGSRRDGYRIGSVNAPDYQAARAAAVSGWPGVRIGFLEDDDAADQRVMAQVARLRRARA